ncbi:MAG: hypothetical protein K6G44_00730 [Lentisphaeria bacterium]|nr:hypothetical protein [Lentisphaeria bacterium]
MMEDLEKLNAMLNNIHQFVGGDESKRQEVYEAFTGFRLIYGDEWISDDIRQIVTGPARGQEISRNLSFKHFLQFIDECFSDLRGRILNQMYVHATSNDYAPKIGEATNSILNLFSELQKIYSIVFNNNATLDEIRELIKSSDYCAIAKNADDAIGTLREIKQSMEQNQKKLTNQIGNVQKGVTMLLASDEINVTPSAEEAAEWYGVTPRTIQNWMSGAKNADFWPGNSAPMSVYREYATRYKAKRRNADGADDGGTWVQGGSILDKSEYDNGYSIR